VHNNNKKHEYKAQLSFSRFNWVGYRPL